SHGSSDDVENPVLVGVPGRNRRTVAGGEEVGCGERSATLTAKDGDAARTRVGHREILFSIFVEVGHVDVKRLCARRDMDRRGERPGTDRGAAGPQEHRYRSEDRKSTRL